ncbi:hypothetical protein BD560DRAFT_432238 [Blakeslea trispora]|nr:hypothetical protein BD560DRAFT_432238 [Blakeslea trispora]
MDQHRESLPRFMDIFEPPSDWRVRGDAPIQRSVLNHQPSLSEIIFQSYDHYLPTQNVSRDFESIASLTHTSPRHNPIDYQHTMEDETYFTIHNETDLSLQQADDASLTTSIFTAAEYSDDSDSSSAKNTRHGHLSSKPSVNNMHDVADTITAYLKQLNIYPAVEWKDYKPQYRVLNESFEDMKIGSFLELHLQAELTVIFKEIYNEIYATMKKMQQLDQTFHRTKAHIYSEMEKEYEVLSISLLSQCNELIKEKEEFKSKSEDTNQDKHLKQQNEKIKLNIGGTIFETSLSTLRRDTNSLLAIMFSGRHTVFAETDGSYFIDRDPSHFRLVLNYLRDARIPPTLLQDTQLCQELLQEAKYYGINGLIQLLQQ